MRLRPCAAGHCISTVNSQYPNVYSLSVKRMWIFNRWFHTLFFFVAKRFLNHVSRRNHRYSAICKQPNWIAAKIITVNFSIDLSSYSYSHTITLQISYMYTLFKPRYRIKFRNKSPMMCYHDTTCIVVVLHHDSCIVSYPDPNVHNIAYRTAVSDNACVRLGLGTRQLVYDKNILSRFQNHNSLRGGADRK